MTNFVARIFDMLSDAERDELYLLAAKWHRDRDRETAAELDLNENECHALFNRAGGGIDRITAIKMLRERVGCTILVAKDVVDRYVHGRDL